MGDKVQAADGKGAKASKASKRPRNITVKILERQGKSVLVEYDQGAGPARVFVPEFQGNEVAEDVLAAGISYGEDWATWVDDKHGRAFAIQLHATQIWTKQDLLTRSNEVRATLQRIYVNDQLEAMLKKAASK